MKKVLSFVINSETYCIDVMSVVSIDQKSQINQIPLTPAHVLGVINLRGQIIPVIDLRKLFQIPMDSLVHRESCTICIDTDQGRLGCVVDSVSDVVELIDNQYESVATDSMNAQSVKYIEQILKIKDKINFLLNTKVIYESMSDFGTISQLEKAG